MTSVPKVIYWDHVKYQLARDFRVHLPSYGGEVFRERPIHTRAIRLWADGTLEVLRLWAWDGASGPTIDSRKTRAPSLTHDALYWLLRQGHLPGMLRYDADRVFEEMLNDTGMWFVRARVWYRAVRMWGGAAALPDAVREPEVA